MYLGCLACSEGEGGNVLNGPMLKIILGNKNYSSWSLRPWLALKHCGIPFEEQVIFLDKPTTQAEIAKVSPSGRVPALVHDDLTIWDSLAICEYLNEQFPGAKLWPADVRARAHARSVSAEMHSGFTALRNTMPMKIRESLPMAKVPDDVQKDIVRITSLWTDCRERFGARGAFLFSAFSIADAMFAPVVTRFRTYGVKLSGAAGSYAESLWSMPAMQEWVAAAKAEKDAMARYETKQ